MPEGRQLETLRRTELAHNRNGILMQSINRVIQVTHVGGREFAGEISEGGAELATTTTPATPASAAAAASGTSKP